MFNLLKGIDSVLFEVVSGTAKRPRISANAKVQCPVQGGGRSRTAASFPGRSRVDPRERHQFRKCIRDA